jgi:hypothetical protein
MELRRILDLAGGLIAGLAIAGSGGVAKAVRQRRPLTSVGLRFVIGPPKTCG